MIQIKDRDDNDLIPLEDTPIFTQLLSEARAKEAYAQFFEENVEPTA